MKPRTLQGVAVTVALALVAILAATAHALPEFLPISNPTNNGGKWTAESGTGMKTECTSVEGTEKLETDTLGTFHADLKGCKWSGGPCNTEGDSAETFLFEGSFHFVYDALGTKDEQEGGSLGVGLLLLPKEIIISCGAFVTIKTKGTLLCLILKPLTSTISHEYHCLAGAKKGEAAQRTYWNDSGTAVSVGLLTSLNGGANEESNLVVLVTITFPGGPGAWMNE